MAEPVVKIHSGELIGRIAETCYDVPYYSFQGIPFAEPPVGPLRFKAPQPVKPWEGRRYATKEGNRSFSTTADNEMIGDEDCLFLNVYTTTLPKATVAPQAVMVWLHGGAFWTGSGNTDLYAPDYLITEDVVLVTLNYRLGFIGFVQFEDPSVGVPGNAALKDIVMALQWVQTNIAQFNGDPGNVTLFGHSAGAIMAHMMVLSPMAEGLFHKVIIQSGTAFIGFDDKSAIPEGASLCASLIGFHSNDHRELYEFFKDMPMEKIMESFLAAKKWMKNRHERVGGPTIESTPYEPMFMGDEPESYYINGQFNRVPMMIGTTEHDGMVYSAKEYEDSLLPPTFDDPERTVPRDLNLQPGSTKSIELGKKIVSFYYGRETPSRRSIDKYMQYQTDVKFSTRVRRTVLLHQATCSAPVYLYRFALESPFSLYKRLFGVTHKGVCHGDDLTYLFHTKYSQLFRPNSIEEKTKYRMVKLWTNFAKTGNPNPMKPDPLLNVPWRPVEMGKMNHLCIGKYLLDQPTAPNPKRAQFWDEIYEDVYKNYLNQIAIKQSKPIEKNNITVTDFITQDLIKNC